MTLENILIGLIIVSIILRNKFLSLDILDILCLAKYFVSLIFIIIIHKVDMSTS
jgi:hypothetical protein